jgi:hypothetical protein
MSTITEIGVGFPGVASVDMVDETNGYVLTTLKAWGVCQPGIDPDSDVTNANHKTYTNAAFDALGLRLSRTASRIRRGTYDAQRDQWLFPARTL